MKKYVNKVSKNKRSFYPSIQKKGRKAAHMADNRYESSIQRKLVSSLNQTVQMKIHNPTGGSQVADDTVWLGGSNAIPGHVFEVDMGTKTTKQQLLESIAGKGETVGKDTDVADAVANRHWVVSSAKYNKSGETDIDPFRMRTKGKYGSGTTINYSQDYHYGPFNLGYVVKVDDQGSSAKMDPSYNAGTGSGIAPKFSNAHQSTGSDNILGKATHTHSSGTLKESETAWDANTKLTGEGARWECVKNNMASLKDNTYFYTTQSGKNSITNPGIMFSNLWLTWSGEFSKKFGISNSEVIGKLKDETTFKKVSGTVPVEDSSMKPDKIQIT